MTSRLSYDYDKAGAVLAGGMSGYLPDIDEAFETKKGICFDYAALMTAMLRAQGIPSQLVIGYAGEVYHAWINVYIENVGWIGGPFTSTGRTGRSWTPLSHPLAAPPKPLPGTARTTTNCLYTEATRHTGGTGMGKRKKSGWPTRDISAFCEQLALVMKAGISMQEGLLLLLEDAQDAAGAETIRTMADEMERAARLCRRSGPRAYFPDT